VSHYQSFRRLPHDARHDIINALRQDIPTARKW
jgi:hypothetical protein